MLLSMVQGAVMNSAVCIVSWLVKASRLSNSWICRSISCLREFRRLALLVIWHVTDKMIVEGHDNNGSGGLGTVAMWGNTWLLEQCCALSLVNMACRLMCLCTMSCWIAIRSTGCFAISVGTWAVLVPSVTSGRFRLVGHFTEYCWWQSFVWASVGGTKNCVQWEEGLTAMTTLSVVVGYCHYWDGAGWKRLMFCVVPMSW